MSAPKIGPLQRLQVNVKYALADAINNRRGFFVGLATILIVVAVIALLQTVVIRSQAVFVRLSEEQVGENDVVFTPDLAVLAKRAAGSGGVPQFWLNETYMRAALAPLADLAGTAPRWTLQARAVNRTTGINASCIMLVLDSAREQAVGIGRTWLRRPLAADETYVSGALLRSLGIRGGRGEKITLQIDLASLTSSPALGDSAALEASLNAAVNAALATLLSTTASANATINLQPVFAALGVTLPPTLGGIDLTALPLSLLLQQQPLLGALLSAAVLPQVGALLRPSVALTVVEAIEGPDGKWPGSLGNVVMLEMAAVPAIVRAALPSNTALLLSLLGSANSVPALPGAVSLQAITSIIGAASSLSTLRLPDYALLVVATVKERVSLYQQGTADIDAYFTRTTNAMYARLGYDFAAVPSAPLAASISGVAFIQLFLSQIFGSVMAVLVILGCMLIYSLLLSNVNDKTYEYGMLRALGLERNSLVGLLFVTAFFFTLPGVSLGLLGAWLLGVPLSLLLQVFTKAAFGDYALPWSAIVLGVVVGLVMPIVANIGPIRRALSRTLRDSLDVYHQTQSETSVKVAKLKGMGFSSWQIILSIVLVVAGFLVYYMIPYAFTFSDFALFLGILNVILLSMVIGLCLIATTVQPAMEAGLLWLLVWGRDAKMLPLMRKNLSAHRPRNQKTALMFTLSLGFIIFAGASFSLQAGTIGDTVKSLVGADCNIFAPSWAAPLPAPALRLALDAELRRTDTLVSGYNFGTFELRANPRVADTRVMNLAGEPSRRIALIGIERNHLQTVYGQFYAPQEWTSSVKYARFVGDASKPDVIESLYSNALGQRLSIEAQAAVVPASILADARTAALDPRNQSFVYTNYADAVVSEALRGASTVTTDTPLKLFVNVRDAASNDVGLWYMAKARAMCSKVPGFFMSSYRQTANGSPVFVSLDNFQAFIDSVNAIQAATAVATSQAYVNTTTPPMENLWISFRAQATARDVDVLVDRLRNVLGSDGIQIINVKGLVDATTTASNAMIIFFNVVAVINSVLSFFLLWLSFDANVRENSWEFGVLRSLGLPAAALTRAYVYEAVAVVLSAVLLGTVVGLLVSITLTLQYNLFLELPFVLLFPLSLFLIVLCLSFAVAIIGAYLPAKQFSERDIATVLRGM